MKDQTPIIMVHDVEVCERCERRHDQLRFVLLLRPVEVDGVGVKFTHWAMCPFTNEPILLYLDLQSEDAG